MPRKDVPHSPLHQALLLLEGLADRIEKGRAPAHEAALLVRHVLSLLAQHQGGDFLTQAEAARLLKVSVETIRRRIKSGALVAKRLGTGKERGRSSVLIRRADLLALLEDARDFEETDEDADAGQSEEPVRVRAGDGS